MNNSTQDSQELIEGLGKAGGGLSSGGAFFLRHAGFPFLNSIVSWERALGIFEKEGEKILSLAHSVEKDKQTFYSELGLIPRPLGRSFK
jgi:hypothetical protein